MMSLAGWKFFNVCVYLILLKLYFQVCDTVKDTNTRQRVADHMKNTSGTQQKIYNLASQDQESRLASKVVSSALLGQLKAGQHTTNSIAIPPSVASENDFECPIEQEETSEFYIPEIHRKYTGKSVHISHNDYNELVRMFIDLMKPEATLSVKDVRRRLYGHPLLKK